MRIAICDDSSADRQALTELLLQYSSSRTIEVQLTEFDSGESFLESYTPRCFDLIFLDVYMTGILGVEAALKLRETDKTSTIVFTTNSRDYGAEAYDVDAFHYLLKPLEKEKLYSVLDKWMQRLAENKTLEIKTGKSSYTVSATDILYVEVQGRVCSVHTGHGVIIATQSLATLAQLLPPSQFCRPIRYCLVAYKAILHVGESSLTLSNGESVPLSRREREAVKTGLSEYRLALLRRR